MDANTGALPSLNASTKVLGAPQSKAKSKTNVGKLAVLGIVIAAFLLMIAALLLYQRHRKRVETISAEPIKVATALPDFATKNAAVENASIEHVKAELKKKDDDEKRRLQAAEEAQAAAHAKAQADAAAEAARRIQLAQLASIPASGGNQSDQAQPPAPPTPYERKLSGGVLVDLDGGTRGTGHPTQQAPTAAGGIALASTGGQTDDSSMGSRLQPTVLAARNAGKLPNLDYLLKRGMSVPCALQTGIDTTLPGFVVCNTLTDVYSANGKTLLLERGSAVLGEQQSGLQHGQARTFVLWTRIDTPKGVFVNIDSPATDRQGYSGVPGYVDTHFWARFGGAILLSTIDDVMQAAATRVANAGRDQNSSTVVLGNPYQNTMRTSQDVAAEALKSTINIPPTLRVNPGTVVHVMVARDVSFEHVFAVVE